MDNDDIDTETLQAQIDMSMSSTNDLISSWIKPSYKFTQSSRSAFATEKDLEEYGRRPPRLGVGAPLPESTGVASREAVRLKSQLVSKGKKRERQEDNRMTRQSPSDDEMESRSGAIKKKPKLDPFAAFKGPNGKAKGKRVDFESKESTVDKSPSPPAATVTALTEDRRRLEQTPVRSDGQPGTGAPIRGEGLALSTTGTPVQSPRKKKKKRKHAVAEGEARPSESIETHAPGSATNGPEAFSRSGTAVLGPALSTTTPTQPGTPEKLVQGIRTLSISPSRPTISGSTSNSPSRNTLRLLNLDGPPPSLDVADGGTSSPKKKRRRKKKKKNGFSRDT